MLLALLKFLQWYSSFLRSLERQYSVVFDTVVKKVLENTKDERKRRSLLDILGFMPKVNFQISGIDMFEKLHHPSVSMRVEGIKYLLASVNKVQSDDKEFVQNILRNRLQEDSYKVVGAVLECQASELASLVGEEFFVMQMIKISAKYWHMSQISDTLKSKVVAYLCSDASFKTKPDAVFFAVLPYLLPKSDEDVPFAICALKSEFASKHKVMSVIQNEIQNLATVTDADFVCSVVSKLITNKKHIFNTTELISMINEIPIFKTYPVYKFIGTILMTASITKATTVEVKWKIMDTVLEYFASSNVNEKVKGLSLLSDQTMSACMQVASKRKLPIQGLLFCLQTLTKNIELSEDVTCRHWWDISSIGEDFHKSNSLFFIKLFEVLLVGCMGEGNAAEHVRTAYICYLKNLFTDVFPNLQAQLGFLSNLWVSHEFGPKHKGIASYELQLRSLLLARSLLLKTEESVGWTMNITTESIIPPLLISLSCPMGPVRVAALECFGALRNTFGAALNQKGYHCLLSNLLEFEEELKLDAEQISVVLYKLLSPDEAVQSCYTSTQKRQLNIIMNALFDCVVQNETPLHFKAALLKILSHVNSSNIMNKLAPVAKEVLSVAVSSGNQLDFYRSAMLRNIFSRFENDTYSSLTKHKEVWNLFKTALFDYKSLVYEENSRITCPSIIAMNQISKDFFDALPNYQQDLLSILVRVATEADSPDVVSAVGHVFKKIVLECKHVVLELEKVRDAQCAPDPLTLKRRTRSQANSARPSVELLKTKEWHEGTTLLELIQNKKKLRGVRLLFPVLFDLLKRCLDFEEQAPVEYIKQLILSSLLHCCQKLSSEAEDNTELSEKEINVELVVQCIRASQNPQTHHHALLVLSQLAGMIPEQVLHNIMAIFTFMGSSILRQDDAYSFQIISKVVDTVIPILVKANEAGVDPRKLFDPVAGVLRVFVDALVDIPEHRQMPLFHKLMVTLGEENFLWLLMALVIESHVRQRTAPDQNKDGMLPKKLNFVVNLTLRFHPLTAIKNSIRLMEYLQNLPMEKDQKDDKVSDQTSGTVTKLFDVSNCSKSEFHHFKYAIVIFLSGMMGDPNFINQVAALPTDEVKDLEQYYAHLIECVLQHIQISVHASEINVGKPTAKFWKCMLAQSYDLLDKVNALLLSDMFLHVILSLLNNTIHTVRRRAMELMNARLQNEEFFMSCKTEDLLSLVKPLLSIISTINEENISFDEQLNQQTALASMKLMARLMASKHIEIFGEILDNLTDLIMKKTLQGNVLASALLCGAELCSCLKAFAVSNLPKFMPALLKVFKKEKKTEKQKLSSEVPLRVLMPVVNTSYFRLLKKKHYEALGPLMSILAGSFAEVSSADFNYLRTELSNFFMAALQFRSDNEEEETSLDIVDSVEGHVIKALVALVLKLSESSFRPLYYNLFHWATALDVHKERLITFYRVSHSIAECLKGLFVLFAGHFIKNAASLLDQTNLCKSNPLVYGKSQSGKAKSLLLLDAVLKTLHSIFLYDSAQFLNKERFDTLMQPLVDQLENTLGGLDMYKERASTLLTPCIVQFAVVTADDSLWKQLNYQILLKTRNSVRLMALQTVCGVAQKLGDDFLTQLPETVPFLAELMEDEEEEVEQACVKVVQEMEEILGEPLKKYF
ncbi:HEAT repeat-containing protein 1 homolog [Gryllus bimaculatus]|nr:HEAT repeat-containing protein 1 homolog [Gryllus bimaculatus]